MTEKEGLRKNYAFPNVIPAKLFIISLECSYISKMFLSGGTLQPEVITKTVLKASSYVTERRLSTKTVPRLFFHAISQSQFWVINSSYILLCS